MSKSIKQGVKECSNHRTILESRTQKMKARYWDSHNKGTAVRDGDGWYVRSPKKCHTRAELEGRLQKTKDKYDKYFRKHLKKTQRNLDKFVGKK